MMLECHITCNFADKDMAQEVAEHLHWTTSEIERDPVLGKASYFYLTTHGTDVQAMFSRMEHADIVLRTSGVISVRKKIELIIYDTKGKV